MNKVYASAAEAVRDPAFEHPLLGLPTLLLDVPLSQALVMGLLPFLPGDALKIAAATAAYRRRPNLLS